MNDLIRKLSEIRSEYNFFNQDEEPYYRALSKAIRILSRHTDDDTISRKAAIDALDGEFNITGRENAETIRDYINSVNKKLRELPSAERRGRWEFNIDDEEWSWDVPFKCTQCGEWNGEETPYCPNCGARMEGELE